MRAGGSWSGDGGEESIPGRRGGYVSRWCGREWEVRGVPGETRGCGCSVAGMAEGDTDVAVELGRGYTLQVLEDSIKQSALYSGVTGCSAKSLLKSNQKKRGLTNWSMIHNAK